MPSEIEFSNQTRLKNIEAFSKQTFDVLVIGGGITGCGIAWDAALRGLKVALIEKGDFASGTSSKSSKLIHGGFRYLEKKQFKLVFEALREKALLSKIFPQFIRPLAFLFPAYQNMRVPFWKLWVGMWLYDLLAVFRSYKLHQTFFSKKLSEQYSFLEEKGLKGGFLYYDALTHDAKLVLEICRRAHEAGARVSNYVSFQGLALEKGVDSVNFYKVQARDEVTSRNFTIKAKWVVNATGPWVDQTKKMIPGFDPKPYLRPTKGIHIVLQNKGIELKDAIVFQTPDGRFIFVIPWKKYLLVGTTDTDYKGSCDDLFATKGEVHYLLNVVNQYMPGKNFSKIDVCSTYAGLRPLVSGIELDVSSISREHEIIQKKNIIHVFGGKLTTFRKMAMQVVDRITSVNSRTHLEKPSHRNPLFQSDVFQDKPIPKGNFLEYMKDHLQYSIQYEMVQTLSDFFIRRTGLFLTSQNMIEKYLPQIAAYFLKLLPKAALDVDQAISKYEADVLSSKKFLI